MGDAFSPDGVVWHPISRRWIGLKRVSMAVWWLVLAALVAGPLLAVSLLDENGPPWWWAAIALGVGVAVLAWRLTRADRLWQAWGYAERDDDLYIRRGIWFRSLTAVPYGRMQLVEVSSGPFQRAFGLATVELKTAASATSASIPGLEAADAARLRERLTALGETRTAGL